MDLKPIPAFYCCYLLRSTVRHSSLYVGSTPNPRRRLAQHNGLIKGGAAKTARATLRPWEMACVVTGFPSQIAALQFEWAWQNTHLTRHIAVPERLTQARTLVRTSPKTGRTRRRPARPRISLTDKLSNLHLLLRVDSFARWPLEVRFFCEDVFGVWQTWTERVDGVIRDGVKVALDPQLPAAGPEAIVDTVATNSQARGRQRTLGTGGVEGLEVSYQPLKGHIEKSINLLGNDSRSSCAVCHAELDRSLAFVATCPQPACEATSHLQCLSSHFLARDSEESAVIPTEGTCPSCKHGLKWVEFVKELSLRSYGHKEVESLTRPRRKKRQDLMEGNGKIMSSQAHAGVSDADDGDEDLELDDFDNVAAALRASMDLSIPDDVGEKWTYWDDDDDGTVSVGSIDSIESELASADTGKAMGREGKRLEIVIEDSDWDEAEVLD